MKKIISILYAALILCLAAHGQITISPDPTLAGICPGEDVEFTLNGIPDCSFTLALISGNTSFLPEGNKFTINAANIPQEIEVRLTFGGENCPTNRQFKIPVLSLSNVFPAVFGCPATLVAGRANTFTLTTEALYEFRGVSDPLEASFYDWSIVPSNSAWTIVSSGALGNMLTVTTDNASSASIRVIATDVCGNNSLEASCSTTRFAEQPTITGAPAFVVCDDTSPFTIVAQQPTSGLTGYTYSWDFGTWSGTSAGNTATVVPDGISAGNISVVATVGGLSSAPASVSIPLRIIHPDTKVGGPGNVCDFGAATFLVDRPLPGSSSVIWEVTPTGLVSSGSGVGTSASFTALSGAQGQAKIKFSITNNCGTTEVEKSFFVGKPIVSGILTPECFRPGNTVTISAQGSGASSFSWTLPGCTDPRPSPPIPGLPGFHPNCWYSYFGSSAVHASNTVYVGRQGGHISVYAENACGTTSRSEAVEFCSSDIIWIDPDNPNLIPGGPNAPIMPLLGGGGPTTAQDQITIYPNPSSNILNVAIQGGASPENATRQVIIMDRGMPPLITRVFSGNSVQIEVGHLPASEYYLFLIHGDNTQYGRFLKL